MATNIENQNNIEKGRKKLKENIVEDSQEALELKRTRNIKQEKQKADYWERFAKGLKMGFYGLLKKYVDSKEAKITNEEMLEIIHINNEKWLAYCTKMFRRQNDQDLLETPI